MTTEWSPSFRVTTILNLSTLTFSGTMGWGERSSASITTEISNRPSYKFPPLVGRALPVRGPRRGSGIFRKIFPAVLLALPVARAAP